MNYIKNVISLSKDRWCTWQHLPGKLLALAAPCHLSCPTAAPRAARTHAEVSRQGESSSAECREKRRKHFITCCSSAGPARCGAAQRFRHKGRSKLTKTDWDRTPNLKTVLKNTEGVACLDPKRGIPNSSTQTLLGQGHCCCWWSQKGKLDTASSKICSSNLRLSILTEIHQREFWK